VDGGGRDGQPAPRGGGRGVRAEEEGCLERAHGGGGGRPAPAGGREARDLEGLPCFFFSLWWVSRF
jgi:hypothetical protein